MSTRTHWCSRILVAAVFAAIAAATAGCVFNAALEVGMKVHEPGQAPAQPSRP